MYMYVYEKEGLAQCVRFLESHRNAFADANCVGRMVRRHAHPRPELVTQIKQTS